MTAVFSIRRLFLFTFLVVLAARQARAQSADYEQPRWHANGFVGFNLTHTSQEQLTGDAQTDQLFPLGDLRLNSDGFLLDPRFLHLATALNYQHGANTSDHGDLSTGGMNLAISSAFLPKSHVPLRISYDRTDHGVSGLGLNQNDDGSRLDVEWNVLSPRLPRLVVSFQKYDNTVHVPASFADRNYNEMAINASASDSWKEWHWTGNFAQGDGNSSGLASIAGLNSNFANSTRSGGLTITRSFWENKARLVIENREIGRHDSLTGDGDNRSSELTNNASVDVQITPHITLDAGYGFSQVDFSGSAFNGLLTPDGTPVQLLALSANTSNAINGRIDYRPIAWLRISQDIRTVHTSPLSGAIESRTSFTDTASTVSAEHRWRDLDLSGGYTGRFQLAATTLDRTPDSWSNSFTGRVGWGNAQRVHVAAAAQDTQLNLVEQIGGFTSEKRAGLEAETHHFSAFRFRVSGEYSEINLLNLSGDTRSKNVSYSAQVDHRRFSLWLTTSLLDGAGAVFPDGLIDRTFLVVPLPVSQLLATPLLNRNTHGRSLGLIGRPRRNLDFSASWRTEDTLLAASRQKFNVLQADGRYRLGRFSVEGGYSRNLNDVTNVTGLTGNRLAIWYFRIGRDFKIL